MAALQIKDEVSKLWYVAIYTLREKTVLKDLDLRIEFDLKT